VGGCKPSPKFFVENLSKIPENLGKIIENPDKSGAQCLQKNT